MTISVVGLISMGIYLYIIAAGAIMNQLLLYYRGFMQQRNTPDISNFISNFISTFTMP